MKSHELKIGFFACIGFILATLLSTAKDSSIKSDLKKNGIVVTAKVTEFRTAHPAKSSSCETAHFEFSIPNGNIFSGDIGCYETQKQDLKIGSLAEVTYLPSSPEINLPGNFKEYSLARDLLTSFVISSIGAFLILSIAWIALRFLRKS